MIRAGHKAWEWDPNKPAVFSNAPGWDMHRMILEYPKGTNGTLDVEPHTCPWCNTKMAIRASQVVIL